MANTDLKNARGGSTQEVSDNPVTPSGVYRHKETGRELITIYDPLYGDVQSEGLVRLGFEYVGPAEEGSIKSIVEQIIDTKSSESKDLASFSNRLAALEGVRDENTALQAELAELRAFKKAQENDEVVSTEISGEKAKTAALEQTLARGVDNAPAVDSGVTNAPATTTVEEVTEQPSGKPFSQLNRAELEEVAAKEEIELPAEADTNAKIREVITKARAEKETK